MSLTEYAVWEAYDRIEYLPDRRTEIQLASINHTLAVVNSRNPSRFTVADFMPSQATEPQSQTPEQFLEGLRNG